MDLSYALYIIAGALGGFINTVASSGSAVTLPLLMMLGVPANVANGTNRMPLLIGSLSACRTFHQKGLIDYKGLCLLMPSILLGSTLGCLLSVKIDPSSMGLAIMAAVFMALVVLLIKPSRFLEQTQGQKPHLRSYHHLIFFLIGIWAGFIVLDSATYMLLSLVLLVGYDLLQANALKNALLVILCIPSMLLLGEHHEIDWGIAAFLSIGSFIGSTLGSYLAIQPQAKIWIFRLLVLLILFESTHMAYSLVNEKF